MSMSVGAPSPPIQYLKVLGSGLYTAAAFGTYEDAGNFTVSALSSGLIKVYLTVEKGASATMEVGVDNVSGNTILFGCSATSAVRICEITIMQRAITTSSSSGTMLDNVTMSQNASTFDFTASETIYIKAKAATANGGKVRWIAYQITA